MIGDLGQAHDVMVTSGQLGQDGLYVRIAAPHIGKGHPQLRPLGAFPGADGRSGPRPDALGLIRHEPCRQAGQGVPASEQGPSQQCPRWHK